MQVELRAQIDSYRATQNAQVSCLDDLEDQLQAALSTVQQSHHHVAACLGESQEGEHANVLPVGTELVALREQLKRVNNEATFAVDVASKLESEAGMHSLQVWCE